MTTDPPSMASAERVDTAALRRAASEAGLLISDRLLETLRWQRLVPRPVRAGHRGRSPIWAYPAEAVPQLLTLLRWRQYTKDPDTLRLLLWVDGYAIPTSDVRAALVAWLERALSTLDREIHVHAKRHGLNLDHDEDLDEVVWQVSRLFANKRGSISLPRQGRVPAAERAHAMNILIRRFLLDVPTDGDTEQEAQTVEKVLGMIPGRTRTIEGSGPWLTGPAAPLLDAAEFIALPRLHEAVRSAADGELEMARETVRATFQFLPFMVRVIGVLTGDDNHIGLAGLRDADQKPEVLFYLIPIIVAMLRAGWTDSLQTVTAALNNLPELAQQAQTMLELPASMVRQNLASQPPEVQERAQRLIDGALSGQLNIAPRDPPRARRRS